MANNHINTGNNTGNNPGNTGNTRSALKNAFNRLGNQGKQFGKWVWGHKVISAGIASGILNCFAIPGCYMNKKDVEQYKQEATTNGVNADQYFIDLQSARDSIADLEMGKQMDEREIEALKQELKDCKNDSLTAYQPRKEIQAAAKDLGLFGGTIRKSIGIDSASLNRGILIIKDKNIDRFARDSVTIGDKQYPFTNDGQLATYSCDGHDGSIELSDDYIIMKEHILGGTFQAKYQYKDGKMHLVSTQITLLSADGTKIYTKVGNTIVVQYMFNNGITLESIYDEPTGKKITE